MYNLLHKNQLHVSALFIGHLQVYQPEDGQWKGPKHVVLYVLNCVYFYHHIVVLDKYKHSNLEKYERQEERGWGANIGKKLSPVEFHLSLSQMG